MYVIEYTKQVKKGLEKLSKKDTQTILDKIESLATNPRPQGVKALHGNWGGCYRIRPGDYRIVYNIEDKILTVYVVKIAHKSVIYQES